MLKRLSLLLLIPLFYTPKIMAQDSYLVKASEGFGSILLGMKSSELDQLLGKPLSTYKVPPNKIGKYWKKNGSDFIRAFFEKDRLIQINVLYSQAVTQKGISLKSNLQSIKSDYPSLKKDSFFIYGSGGGLIDYYDAVNDGIAFAFTSPDTDPPHFKLYSIVVHKKGEKFISEPNEKKE